MDARPPLNRFLAHPGVDGYLRFCLSLLGGGLLALATFVALILIRVWSGFAPLPKAWAGLVVVSIAAGMVGALAVFVLHRLRRRCLGANRYDPELGRNDARGSRPTDSQAAPRILQAQDIIGQRLVRIAQVYEKVDGWLDSVSVWFVLEDGVAFELPAVSAHSVEGSAAPAAATPARGRAVDAVLGERVTRLLRPTEEDDELIRSTVVLEVGGRYWLSVRGMAPHGLGASGLYISTEPPEPTGDFRDFWPDEAEA